MGNQMRGPYKCVEPGCKGHQSFNETCSTITNENNGYPILDQFIKGVWMGQDDQPGNIQIIEEADEQETRPYQSGPSLMDAPLDTHRGYKKKSDLGKAKQAKIR